MMRIVSLGANLFPASGGTYRAASDSDQAFQASGIEHSLVSFCNRETPPASSEAVVIRTSGPRLARKYFWWNGHYSGQMSDLLNGADLLFIHGLFIHPLLRATLWARQRGIPYVVVPHGSLDPFVFTYRRFRKRAWMRLYGKSMVRHSARVLFSTLRERDKAVDCDGAFSSVLPWPVSHRGHYDEDQVAMRIRAVLGLPETQRLALFCGRLHPIKRPLETIQAFLKSVSPEWTLIVIGDSTPELSIERVREEACGVGNRIRVVGPVYGESLEDYFRAAELVLLLSHKENFGYVVAEALSFGTPVVVTNEVDLSPHIEEERCGFVIQSCEGDRMWRKIQSILQIDKPRLKELGQRGREWARRDLSQDRFRHELVELSRSIITSTRANGILV